MLKMLEAAELRPLKEMSLRAVRTHFTALAVGAILDLPVTLIKDLLPYLTVCQLDELQPSLNQRGISTYSGWVGVLKDMCGPKHVVDSHTEDQAKHKVMRTLFPLVFYGYTNSFIHQNITNLNTPSFLWAAAKCMRHFLLIMGIDKPLQSLVSEQQPLLTLLEKCISSVGVSQSGDPSKRNIQIPLYVLHRLLDHGLAKSLVLNVQCPVMLAWLLQRRGSQYMNPELKSLMYSKQMSCVSQTARGDGTMGQKTRTHEGEVAACKRPKLDSVCVEKEDPGKANFTVDPQALCRRFSPCDGPPAGTCPWGEIHHLELRQCGSDCLRVLNSALPTFVCLRSLTLHSLSIFSSLDVLGLAGALKQLYESSQSSLTDLSISALPSTELVDVLLDANPHVTSLQVEIQSGLWGPRCSGPHRRTSESDRTELPLRKLTVKVSELHTELHLILSVLRRSPHLTSFHGAGLRLPAGSSQSQLLTTLSESNGFLRSLTLEDMKLSDCLPEILHLLRGCRLEELRLNDCRLLESCSNKEEALQQLVAALKAVASLHTLGLAQNRLAKNVCVLAELFWGCSLSSVKRLDVSCNFIQPAELLEFAQRLKTHRPPHQLTLDLRKNPGDRDPNTWSAAIKELCPFCVLLVEGWTSSNTMADHISNM